MPNTLLHCCCAPCSVRCIEDLRGEGIEPTAYWYNPTIHPYQEYKARRDTLVSYASTIAMALVVDEDYGLRPFVQAVASDIDHRCAIATPAAWIAPPAMPQKTALTVFLPRYLSPPTRITN